MLKNYCPSPTSLAKTLAQYKTFSIKNNMHKNILQDNSVIPEFRKMIARFKVPANIAN